ncbi:hypothetical protein TRVA0_049S00276 [Trichomonascus vanleenenianus]|uniref:uncharacterized protein n=1 Tax=Trichomonascus vanleenenianus TaxID=2268995 RepID=UPI003ECB30B6
MTVTAAVYDSGDPGLPSVPLDIAQYQQLGYNEDDLEEEMMNEFRDPGSFSDYVRKVKEEEESFLDRSSSSSDTAGPKELPKSSIFEHKSPFIFPPREDDNISPRTTQIALATAPFPGDTHIKSQSLNIPQGRPHLADQSQSRPASLQSRVSRIFHPSVSFAGKSSFVSDGTTHSHFSRLRHRKQSIGSARLRHRGSIHPSIVKKSSVWQKRVRSGLEPGNDVDRLVPPKNYDNPLGSQVTIVDYYKTQYKVRRIEITPNEDETLDDSHDLVMALEDRPQWSKVRWINVAGQSGMAVKAIGKYYKLHKLAIEDMIFAESRATKAERYPTHTFCCFPLFKCMNYIPRRFERRETFKFWRWFFPRSESSEHDGLKFWRWAGGPESSQFDYELRPEMSSKNKRRHTAAFPGGTMMTEDMTLARRIGAENPSTIYRWNNPEEEQSEGALYLESRRPLAGMGKALGVEEVYLFLTDSGTVISFFDKGGARVETPVLSRICTDHTILRESEDPSMLLQAVIDCAVDEIYPIVAQYRKKLDELEIAAVMNPTMGHTQDLHLLNAELTILRNAIVPITSLLNSLRDHSGLDKRSTRLASEENESENALAGDAGAGIQSAATRPGLTSGISDLAVVYLADVADHTMTYTQDLDVMRNNAKSMTELIFNTISIQSSDAVRLLSLVTVVFLPLSFLTGYYGMNFTQFDSLNNSVTYYWAIAIPFCVCLTTLLMWQWVRDKMRNIKNQLVKSFKQERIAYRQRKARKFNEKVAAAEEQLMRTV